MAGRGRKKSIKIAFVNECGVQDAVYVPSGTDSVCIVLMRRAVKELAAEKRKGFSVSERVKRDVEGLPGYLRKKLIEKNLIEGKPNEVVPTLGEFLERYVKSRAGQSKDSYDLDKRFRRYLLEYFGADRRLDTIKPIEAEAFRSYLVKERTACKGLLSLSSANKVLQGIKALFRSAVEWDYLKASPFAKIDTPNVLNTDRQYYVKSSELEGAANICKHLELKGILAFARYAGLRVPCEIIDLKFSDFEFFGNGDGIFNVSASGKTGQRRVPFFEELKPHFEAVRSRANPGQVYVFEKYRHCKNVGTIIKKQMKRAGLPVWEKFFINLRSSCITDKERLGWSRSMLDAAFGNSEQIRNRHYVQPLPDGDYAAMGRSAVGCGKGAHPVAHLFGGTDGEFLESVFGTLGEELGFPMSGKELLADFFSSNEYASTVSNINLLLSDSCDYSKGKISDRKMRSKMKKYYKRLFQDAMDVFDEELGKITAKTDRAEGTGVEPATRLRAPHFQ